MKIGIDAKWFFTGPPSGKMVIENLVNEICSIDSEHHFYLFLDKKYKSEKNRFCKSNVTPVFVWAGNNLISNVFLLPFWGKKHRIDVCVYQNFCSLYASFKQISYIHDVLFVTHPQYYTLLERIYFRFMIWLSYFSTSVITVSNTERARLTNIGISKHIDVVHHGVNGIFRPKRDHSGEELSEIKRKYKLPNEYILFVGRLNARKNIRNLLYGMTRINSNIPLVIVGPKEWQSKDLHPLINSLKISDKIFMVGGVYGDDLAKIYSEAKLFVFPSYAESFGLPALEAMACGIPVIVSNTTCMPEICGDAGNYVNPNSPDEIAEKIDSLLADKNLYEQKSVLGVAIAKEFSWRKAALEIINICENA